MPENKPQWIVVHHEGALSNPETKRFLIINDYHKSRGFPQSKSGWYVGYHRVIERNGEQRVARQDEEIGAHTVGYNDKSLGVCLVGHFDFEFPKEAQVAILKQLLKEWVEKYNIPIVNVVPHRRFANKSCYGSKLSDSWARDLITEDRRLPLMRALLEAYKKLLALIKKT